MGTMRALELRQEKAVLHKPRVYHGPTTHEAWQHTALVELLEGVPALRVDRPEHASSIEEHVARRIAE